MLKLLLALCMLLPFIIISIQNFKDPTVTKEEAYMFLIITLCNCLMMLFLWFYIP